MDHQSAKEVPEQRVSEQRQREFAPWEDFKVTAPVPIEVAGPPCARCRFWSPRVVTNSVGDYSGVRLCTAKDMYFDFSCFSPKQINDHQEVMLG